MAEWGKFSPDKEPMPALVNLKHETACQNYASGLTQIDAYQRAGFKRSPEAASKFFKRDEIAARMAELYAARSAADEHVRETARAKAVEKHQLTEDWIIERLKYLIEVSIRGQPVLDASGKAIPGAFSGRRDGGTAMRGLELASRIQGMLVDRHEVGAPGAFDDIPDDKLESQIESMAKQLGFKSGKIPKGLVPN